MATLQNIGKLKYRGKDGQWHPLPVVVQDASGGVSTISGKGAPTSATQGKVNQLYRDEDTQKLYICTATDGGYTWTAVVSDTEDAVTYTAQTLTEEQKTQARANIGAGTSNFSGSYNDLSNKPNIPAATVIDNTLTKSGQAADAKAAGDAIEKKLDKAQGVENAGMILAVDNNGNVFPVEPSYLPGLVSYTMAQGLTYDQQALAKKNIGAGTLRNVYYWRANGTPENPNGVLTCAINGDTCICGGKGDSLPDGMQAPVLVIYGSIDRGYRDATAFDGSNATWTFTVNLRDYSYSTPIKKSGVPAPTTAQVGQIVKVKSVDESGKITETETVDMPMQKTLKWITVNSSDLTEETTEIVVSADQTGKAIADYNPVGLTLIISTPADATQTGNDGAPRVYPSATKKDSAIRVIGSIAGWKTIARDNVFAFYGGSSAMTCTGNVNKQIATYKIDGYALDGVTAMLNGNTNHFPVGTHVEVSILCEVEQ